MGPDDRPEDEREPAEGAEQDVGSSEDEPDGLAMFGDDEGERAEALEPGDGRLGEPDESSEPGPDDKAPAGPSTVDEEAPAEAGPPRHRALRVLAVFAGALAVGLLLVGWNRVASSDDFCASCHEMEPAVTSAQRSVHEDVPCLSCHTGSGLLGAVRYLPTLARETIDEFTGWDVAHGVLEAQPCESCHTDIASTPELAAAHQQGADCRSCHGDVAHPPYRLAGFERPVAAIPGENPHPRLYVQTHGGDVLSHPDTCLECHESNFCETCHLRETYPHPAGWIDSHGAVQREQGIASCVDCHPETFCAGCHGTAIPHEPGWLGEHWRDLQDEGSGACLLCHPKTDCTQCHAEHEVHPEQDLYV